MMPRRISGITPAQLGWGAVDIVVCLQTGLTPDFDLAGGTMADVPDSLSALPAADLAAISACLLIVPDQTD